METQDWHDYSTHSRESNQPGAKAFVFEYEISIWSKIWGELQKKFFFRERAGSDPEGGKTGSLAFISRETPSTRDTFVLKFLTFP